MFIEHLLCIHFFFFFFMILLTILGLCLAR